MKPSAMERLVEILKILQINGVKVRRGDINQKDTILDVLNRQNIGEEIREEISKTIDLTWPIGKRISVQRERNQQEFSEMLNVNGLPDVSEKTDATRELISVLKLLQENGVKVQKEDIRAHDTVQTVLEKQNISKEIAEKIEKTIDLAWPIRVKIEHQKMINAEGFREKLAQNGLPEELSDIKKKEAAKDLIYILKVLQEYGVKVDKASVKRHDRIIDILNRQNISEEVKKQIEEKIGLSAVIGLRMYRQKIKRPEKIREELKDNGLPDLLEKSERVDSTKTLIDTLKLLNESGIEIEYIKQKDKVSDVIKRANISEAQKRELEEKLDTSYPIGVRITDQSFRKNKDFREALKENGLPEELAYAKKISRSAQEIGQATFNAPVKDCDEAARAVKELINDKDNIGGNH